MTTNTITTTKAQLTNRMKKLGNFLKVHKDDVDMIYNKIEELFPKSCEVFVYDDEPNNIYFVVGEDYVGSAPPKKEMLKNDSNFKRVYKMGGMMINVYIEDDKITMSCDIDVEYEDKWGCYHTTDAYIKEMGINL